MTPSADSIAHPVNGFEAALESFVTAERDRMLVALAILAPVTGILALHVPIVGAAVAIGAIGLVLKHVATRYRIRSGNFGKTSAEQSEILTHMYALECARQR